MAKLIGDRFLCRQGTLLFVGAAGMGKSTFTLQMCCNFALGRDFLGIEPSRALKTLYIQAENDTGDLAEIFQGMCKSLDVRSKTDESAMLHKNLKIYTEDEATGEEFLSKLSSVAKQERPDLILIDPLLSYIGGDINQQEVVSGFLRNGLNPILRSLNAACILVHHTNKSRANDSYGAAGSAELINHPRAVMNLFPSKNKAECDLILEATKRGGRLGLENDLGEPCQSIKIRRGRPGLPDFTLVGAVSVESEKEASKEGASKGDEMRARRSKISGYLTPETSRAEAIKLIVENEGVSIKTAGRDYDSL